MQSAIDALRGFELVQQENLIEVLGAVSAPRNKTALNNVQSIARGLCTINQKIISSINICIADAESQGVEAYKNFVNEFILWFSGSSVIFDKYLHCLPPSAFDQDSVFQKPLVHYEHYLAFIDVALASLRNPFVVDKLKEAHMKIDALVATKRDLMRRSHLDNISFEHVQSFGGSTVSCFFTVSQIIERTEDATIFMGDKKVELALLNLDKESSMYTMRDFNALAILEFPVGKGARTVVYPPFRINDLSMSLSNNCINFSSVSYASDSEGASFALTGSELIILEWYEKLKLLFPASDEVLSSETILLEGLGINTMLESYRFERTYSFNDSNSVSLPLLSHRQIRQDDSAAFEYSTASTSKLDNSSLSRQSLRKDTSSQSDACSVDSDGFEIVTKNQVKVFANNEAAQSLPNIQASKPRKVFQNTAGSAIDISNFGKSHKPTFTPDLKVQEKKSFFGLFRRRQGSLSAEDKLRAGVAAGGEKAKSSTSKKVTNEKEMQDLKSQVDLEKKSDVLKSEQDIKTASAKPSTKRERVKPDLKISIPKSLDAPQPAFLSLKSTLFSPSSALPLPFALPSSTSTYFFKHYVLENPNLASENGSAVDLSALEQLPVLQIPQGLKDEINSEDSLDFFISPSTTKTLKVSKWKARAGKWEMLTASDDVFVKIVVNYILDKRWMLVFKEDASGEEVVDVPLLILELTAQSNFRRSSATDIEIGAVNAVTREKMLVITRCYKGEVFDSFYNSLSNCFESLKSPGPLQKSSNYGSSGTLTSSLMSRPSTSSTLASLYTSVDQKSIPEIDASGGEKVLLERMTVKVHKQLESYDHIHQLSAWKAISMYSLSLFHSVDEFGASFFHFNLYNKRCGEDNQQELEWTFSANSIEKHVEKIGKAGLLVKADSSQIYMLECKGGKELKRLLSTF